MPWITRHAISQMAPPSRWNGSKDNAMAATVNTANPML